MGRIEDLGLVADKGLEWKSKYETLTAERDQLRAEVERLRGEVAAKDKILSLIEEALENDDCSDLSLQTRVECAVENLKTMIGKYYDEKQHAEAAERERDEAQAQLAVASNNARHYADLTVELEAHAADLRGALEEVEGDICLSTSGDIIPMYFERVRATLARTPRQSLARLKQRVLREAADTLEDRYGHLTGGASFVRQLAEEATDGR